MHWKKQQTELRSWRNEESKDWNNIIVWQDIENLNRFVKSFQTSIKMISRTLTRIYFSFLCHRLKCHWNCENLFISVITSYVFCLFSHFRHVFAPLELKCHKELMHTYFLCACNLFSHFILALFYMCVYVCGFFSLLLWFSLKHDIVIIRFFCTTKHINLNIRWVFCSNSGISSFPFPLNLICILFHMNNNTFFT